MTGQKIGLPTGEDQNVLWRRGLSAQREIYLHRARFPRLYARLARIDFIWRTTPDSAIGKSAWTVGKLPPPSNDREGEDPRN
jgi:hypothetical protein